MSIPTISPNREWFSEPYGFFQKQLGAIGDTFFLRFPMMGSTLVTGDPVLAKEILQNKNLIGGAGLKVLRPIIGERSTIMLSGPEHNERRKVVNQIFDNITDAEQAALVSIIEEHLAHIPSGKQVKLYEVLQHVLLEHVITYLFGGVSKDDAKILEKHIHGFMHAFESPLFIFVKPFQMKFFGLTPWDRFLASRDALTKHILGILERYDVEVIPRLKPLRLGLADKTEIAEEVIALLLFGHDTTTAALSWLMLNVLSRPEVANQIANDPSQTALKTAIADSHRMTPAVTQLIRMAQADTKVGDIEIRKGQRVYINLVMLHQKSPTMSLPFGAGTRLCIGKNLADKQIQITAATLLKSPIFALALPVSAYKPKRNNVIVSPSHGLLVKRL